jgi:very-short-patch-repair endonuclease
MTPDRIHNQEELKNRRKGLRKKLTPAEATLWLLLKDKKLEGRKFRRQHSVGKYIVDFYCPSEKLVIELDGERHFTDEGMQYDQKRTDYLNTCKIRVLRFENHEVFQSPEGVLDEIKRNFIALKSLPPAGM